MSKRDYTVEFSKEDIRAIERIAAREPKAVKSGWNASVTRATASLRKAIRTGGGNYGVPAFPPQDTSMFRGGQWAGRLGGASLKRTILKKSRGMRAVIGFNPDFGKNAAASFGEAFQTSASRAWTKKERWVIHRFLRMRTILNPTYHRPAREIIPGFAGYLRGWLPKTVRETTEKRYRSILKRRVAK